MVFRKQVIEAKEGPSKLIRRREQYSYIPGGEKRGTQKVQMCFLGEDCTRFSILSVFRGGDFRGNHRERSRKLFSFPVASFQGHGLH